MRRHPTTDEIDGAHGVKGEGKRLRRSARSSCASYQCETYHCGSETRPKNGAPIFSRPLRRASGCENSERCNAACRPAGKSRYAPVRMTERPFCKLRLPDGHAVCLPEIFVFKSDDDVSAIVCRADHASRSGNLNHDITLFCFCFPGFYFGYGIAMGGGEFETLRFDNTLRRRRLPTCTCDDLTRLHDRERR